MTDDGLTELRRQLGGTVPDGMTRLSDAELRDLAAAVREARHRQTAALAASGERALEHVPRLLRGPIRKVVG
jgi:hypothetical protein